MRCVRNLQLVAHTATVSTSLNKFANSEVELRRVGSVNAPIGSRRELVANSVHSADSDATQLDSCVASAVCIGLTVMGINYF